MSPRISAPILAVTLTAVAACNETTPTEPYDPVLPSNWASAITHPLFPLTPGTAWSYEFHSDEGLETIEVEVPTATRVVNGVSAVVVHDEVFLDGDLIEDTYDWYAQDADGNVWYLGEETEELENGVVVGTAGSWEWTVDSALPGIYHGMPADRGLERPRRPRGDRRVQVLLPRGGRRVGGLGRRPLAAGRARAEDRPLSRPACARLCESSLPATWDPFRPGRRVRAASGPICRG